MIQLENVNKVYHPGKHNENHVLKDISCTIHDGDMVAIMGKSGSGKTTLLNVLGLLDKPISGIVRYGKEDVTRFKEHQMAGFRAKHVGIVLQNFALLANESVASNVTLPLLFAHKKKTPALKEVLKLCQIPDFQKRKVRELSGGEMQRVAIARALITDPEIILADEPTGSLDSATSRGIMELLLRLHRAGKTILLVTHDEEVAGYCERIWHLKDGRMTETAGSHTAFAEKM